MTKPLRHPQSILVRGVNWLGDAVMTTPALASLRAAHPNARVTVLTLDTLADLYRGFAPVDSILTFQRNEPLSHVARKIRRTAFDLGLVFPNSTRSALELFLARVPTRVGYARSFGSLLLTRAIDRPPSFVPMRKRSVAEIRKLTQSSPRPPAPPPAASAHHLYHYQHLAAALGGATEPTAPVLSVTADEINAFRQRFRWNNDPAMRPLTLGLNAGAAYGSAKQWPLQRFIDAAIELRRRMRCHWILLGGPADVTSAKQIEQALASDTHTAPPPPLNLAGQTSLRELCAALKLCDVVLCNDSGPMHLAAALGARVVVPFGSTSLQLTGPGLPANSHHALIQGSAPCATCFLRECPIDHRCMTSITVEQVVAACQRAAANP